jgi:hypothetical protein
MRMNPQKPLLSRLKFRMKEEGGLVSFQVKRLRRWVYRNEGGRSLFKER